MPNTVPVVQVGTTAQRAASAKILGAGDYFVDTDVVPPRGGYGDGVTAANLLPHIAGTRHDGGETFQAKRDMKSGRAVAFVASDSTGDCSAVVRWPRRIWNRICGSNTDAQVVYSDSWNDTTKVYGLSGSVLQAGTNQSTTGVKVTDTFARTAADLKGSTADTGQVWAGVTSAAGDWSLDGAKAQRTSDATTGTQLIDSVAPGDRTVTVTGITLSTVNGTGTVQSFRVYIKYLDSANNIFGGVTVSTSGVCTWAITKVIAGTASTVAAGVGNPFAVATAGQTCDMSISIVGTTVTFSPKSGSTVSGSITSGDATTLAPATQDGFTGWTPSAMSIDGFQVTVTTVAGPALQLVMYNASITGSILSAQINQLATMCPETPDIVFINSIHNYTGQSTAAFLTAVDQFINRCLATWPNVGIVVMSQNPEKAPSISTASHLTKNLAVRAYCRKKGVDYIPVMEAFRTLSDGGVSLVRSDGVHPTSQDDTADAASGTAAANGAQLWERVIWTWLTAKVLQAAPLT